MLRQRNTAAFAVLVLLLAASRPRRRPRATVHFNFTEDPLGDTWRYAAGEVTSTWTFSREADFVLSFEGGSVAYNGSGLEPGCYSDTGQPGDVLQFDAATGVEFVSPATDGACASIPTTG